MSKEIKQKSKTSKAPKVTTKDLRLGRAEADKIRGGRLASNHNLTVR